MSTQHEKFVAAVETMKADFEKFFDKGTAAAGTRVRKACQELTKLCKEIRNEVTDIKNSKKAAKGE
jgi:ABC-type Zn uptake system ZnuABC Zn-binding protein ZnuA